MTLANHSLVLCPCHYKPQRVLQFLISVSKTLQLSMLNIQSKIFVNSGTTELNQEASILSWLDQKTFNQTVAAFEQCSKTKVVWKESSLI